jgi:hypothetical protein
MSYDNNDWTGGPADLKAKFYDEDAFDDEDYLPIPADVLKSMQDSPMPTYPEWRDGTLHTPPAWLGKESGIQFSSRQHPDGIVLVADIPGETTSVISALCDDGNGMLDVCETIDLAVAVAVSPEAYDADFVKANTLRISVAKDMFLAAAMNMEALMGHGFRDPEQGAAYDLQQKANKNGAGTMRRISERLDKILHEKSDPMVRLAAVDAYGLTTYH